MYQTAVEDGIFIVEAGVDDVGEVDKQTVVWAGMRLVGRHAFVSPEFVNIVPVDDDAVAWQRGGDVHPSTNNVKFLIFKCIGVNGKVYLHFRGIRIIGFAVA